MGNGLGFRVYDLGCKAQGLRLGGGGLIPRMENQLNKKIGNYHEVCLYRCLY